MPGLFDGDNTQAAGQPAAGPNVCERCGLVQRAGKEHDTERKCIDALKRSALLLVEKLATPRACKECSATIYMVPTSERNGNGDRQKPALKPYDANGQSHFLSCPAAARFYR